MLFMSICLAGHLPLSLDVNENLYQLIRQPKETKAAKNTVDTVATKLQLLFQQPSI